MRKTTYTVEELARLPNSLEQAVAVKSKHYFPNVFCTNGHKTFWQVYEQRGKMSGSCIECKREIIRKSAEKRRRKTGVPIRLRIAALPKGEQYGKLIALGEVKTQTEKGKNREYQRTYHKIKCSCGRKPFYWILHQNWGKYSECKYCSNAKKLSSAIKATQEKAHIEAGQSKTIRGRLVHAAMNRAKKNNLKFSINVSDISIPKYCPVLGVELDVSIPENRNSRTPRENAPSLDRINQSGGYTKDNILVVSFKANAIRRDGTPEEHYKIAKFLESFGL